MATSPPNHRRCDTRVPDVAGPMATLERAVRLAKREGASAVRMTRHGTVVIELHTRRNERVRAVPPAQAQRWTRTSASASATATPSPRRRAGSASRRARSAARLKDFQDAKRLHEKKQQTLLRLRGHLRRALIRLRHDLLRAPSSPPCAIITPRICGTKRTVDAAPTPPSYASTLLDGPKRACGALASLAGRRISGTKRVLDELSVMTDTAPALRLHGPATHALAPPSPPASLPVPTPKRSRPSVPPTPPSSAPLA